MLICLYRTEIKFKKWTLRLITHAFHIAVTNTWLEYKLNANHLGIPYKNQLDLLALKEKLGEDLITVGKPCTVSPGILPLKRGRPKSNFGSPSPTPELARKRILIDQQPSYEKRFDKVDHFPLHDNNPHALVCKRPGCHPKSHWVCCKCNVHLCITATNNCVFGYHNE